MATISKESDIYDLNLTDLTSNYFFVRGLSIDLYLKGFALKNSSTVLIHKRVLELLAPPIVFAWGSSFLIC